ncbi:RNA 2',3'-cyclic phosphodiesterase [Tropicimonas sp.]|uniref:RNA 2',3'-cyclic phosphodiesterase n=1 Tax=Tropicimonas sp. TaxID=2067044 RepID=UPI003A8C8844
MRCFVAIPLPDETRDRLSRLQSAIPFGRRTPRENLHLTLVFLGEMSSQHSAAAHAALEQVRAPAFGLEFAGLDLFGGRRPQILLAAIRPAQPLLALQQRVVQAVRAAGVGLRRERYRPHVTLARFNHAPSAADAGRLGAFLQAQPIPVAQPFAVEGFGLWQSVLGHGPARHSELAHYLLDTDRRPDQPGRTLDVT